MNPTLRQNLLTLTPPTKTILHRAAKLGTVDVYGFGDVPRLQIVTIEEALARKEASVETRIRQADTDKAAPKEAKKSAQTSMDL